MYRENVLEKSKPNCITGLLGTSKMWCLLFMIMGIYYFTIQGIISNGKAFEIGSPEQNDYFSLRSKYTKMFFVNNKIGDVMWLYRNYI